MTCPILPPEIWAHIYSILHNNAAQIIINYWYNYIQNKTILTQLILKYNNYTLIDNTLQRRFFINPHTISLLIRMYNTLSGNENYTWWTNVIKDFKISINNYKLFYDSHNFNHFNTLLCNPYSIIIAEKYCNKLLNKFNYNYYKIYL